jgi:hypothetical protein
LTSENSFVQNLVVGEPFANSDHQIIRFQLACSKDLTQENSLGYNYFKADYNVIRDYAKSRNWESIIECNDLETSWHDIKTELIDMRNKFVPNNKKSKNKCKWVTKKVVRCRKAKKKAWNNYIQNGRNMQLYSTYLSKLKESVKANKVAKHDFENKLANNIKQDSKSFYAYIRSKQRCKEKVGPLKDNAGNVVNDDKLSADLLNNYFTTVFTHENVSNIPEPDVIFTRSIISEGLGKIIINEEVVYSKLVNLNANKSPGVDGLHPKFLYELRDELVKPLSKLFVMSLELGKIPQDWKDANITPLFKKGSKSKAENYRPISLTSVVGKLLESIIKDNLLNHLEKYKLLRDSQHGFRKGRSCLTNLLEFMEDVTRYLDAGDSVDLVYLDFAKAFDKVPFIRLLRKIKSHGIWGQTLNWIGEWLSGRRQRVSVNKTFSEWQAVTSGVPQGSVLGPILFLIYINDIDSGLVSKLCKFADDSKLCKNIRNGSDRDDLQNDLDSLCEWSREWQMQFNVDKCSVLHLGYKNLRYNYKLGNVDLKSAVNEKDLGVVVDSSSKWSEQCSIAVRNANSALGIIRRHITSRKQNIIVKLYKALVRPKLEYCVQVWSPF